MRSLVELQYDVEAKNRGLYRIIGVERLFQLLTESALTLLPPGDWEDPYEGSLLNIVAAPHRHRVYGLCWSDRPKSDALWRIYSQNRLGVRISTTVGRLIKAIRLEDTPGLDPENMFVGAVSYIHESYTERPHEFGKHPLGLSAEDFSGEIRMVADAIAAMKAKADREDDLGARDIAKSLLIKRKAFEHESEVRLIYVGDGGEKPGSGGRRAKSCKIQIDPSILISSIQFDPRLDDEVFESLATVIRSHVAMKSVRVSKSDLYKRPDRILNERRPTGQT